LLFETKRFLAQLVRHWFEQRRQLANCQTVFQGKEAQAPTKELELKDNQQCHLGLVVPAGLESSRHWELEKYTEHHT
jgi:hypothetical protein